MLRRRRFVRFGRLLVVLAVVIAAGAFAMRRPVLAWAAAHHKSKPHRSRPVRVPADTKALEIDVDPTDKLKYKANFKRDAAVMLEAERRIGITEDEGTWNRGPEVDAYLKTCGTQPGYPWCAAFVAHTIHTAYPKSKWIASPSCQEIFNWAKRNHLLKAEPSPSSVVLYPDATGTFHHIGFVTAYDKDQGVITAIEGNSNDTGSPEGREIVEIKRYVQPGMAFVKIV
ncbi:MAG: CHAP domain-containing protein [Armatimonadetes bacterium]|nr:CHAP domain-containing protein [Armatimonadota bacterium]